MDWNDAASWISASAAALATIFAGYQIRQLGIQDRSKRASELASVAVVIEVLLRPWHADAAGNWTWRYKFTVVNPGRLPVSNVQVRVRFPVEVQRVHGGGTIDNLHRELAMDFPVIAPGGEKSWERTIRISSAVSDQAATPTTSVDFFAADGGELRTVWPDANTGKVDSKLRKMVAHLTLPAA